MWSTVYMPLFARDCEAAVLRPAGGSTCSLQSDTAWVSLYCAVPCTGVYYMGGREHRQLGLNEGYAVARALYQLTVEAINAPDFIVVQSSENTRRIKVLLACANTMGQGLGHRLHLIVGPSDNDAPAAALSFAGSVDRQVRQRIWCFLCTQDWYLIASKKAYAIVPEHNSTPVPANCREDFDGIVSAVPGTTTPMQDCPLSVQTQSTYMIFLFCLTSIYRGLFDELRHANARTDTETSTSSVVSACFDRVLAADRRLEAAMGEIDEFSKGETTSASSSSSPSAQWRALVSTSWHQRVMIHCTFFCRSFQDKRYHYSRFACLAAARKILRSYLDTTSSPSTLTAATATAAPDTSDSEIWSIPTHAISGCLAVLRARPRPNSIVDRGIRIIQHLLHTTNTSLAATKHSYRRLDPHEIAQLARDIDMDGEGECPANLGPRTERGARPVVVAAPLPAPTPTTTATTATPTTTTRSHSPPDFALALLNSQLEAFQPRPAGSSVGGDDELFMPWWFGSMLNGMRFDGDMPLGICSF
ncbi:hypothetical protein SCUCBS95973_009355 [Sporothrix curviconia]|uniref:Transcription factor domain-containing protein n=1 Tax=Sporothrix curviconia TaxID=1260050 RepID=A0ABP0CV93_9PEZI